jgi:trk system potassium uptake protein TrkH
VPDRSHGLRRPEVLLPVTFLGAIVAGTVALLFPGTTTRDVALVDLFFTATSAVCVTGHTVVDTGGAFTFEGQLIVLVLVQAGGLGIMTFSYLALVIAGRRLSLGSESVLKEFYAPAAKWRLGPLLFAIVGSTLFIEALGFAALWRATGDPWSACFHAVSGFCNAGFSLYRDSFASAGLGVVLPVAILFVTGGLGFTTLTELARLPFARRGAARRLSLHAYLVLKVSLILWLGGALLLFVTERGKPDHALFMSASARTAGFETLPTGSLAEGSLLVLIFLMFVGASPGSTGGGIKTTTLAVAVALVLTAMRGGDRVTIRRREIPRDLLRRMFCVFVFALLAAFVGVFLVVVFERGRSPRVLPLMFEVVSALSTVGLTTGITPDLTVASKLLLCVVMFVGRVGSLSLFTLLVRERPPSHVRYPEERVLIG